MNKPASLRQALTRSVPLLAAHPDKLKLYVDEGGIAATGNGSLSFEYAYTLHLVVMDYGGHPDQIMVPLLDWLSTHQPEMLRNRDLMRDGFRFEVDILSHTLVDIDVKLKLSERVGVQRVDAGYRCTHFDEPTLDFARQPLPVIVDEGTPTWPAD